MIFKDRSLNARDLNSNSGGIKSASNIKAIFVIILNNRLTGTEYLVENSVTAGL
jgi:hypothetical protein